MIGDDVSVTVLGVKGNQVRTGVSAPKEVAVHREEIHHQVHSGESQNLAMRLNLSLKTDLTLTAN